MIEPGNIIETDGIVPLRFVVLATGLDFHDTDRDMALYCSARHESIIVNESDFMELEGGTVIEMTKQQIKEQINPKTAEVADDARVAYLDGTGGAEVM